MRFLAKSDQKVRQIPIEHIFPGKTQPRGTFDQAELEELAQSIRANGVLQPLTVRRAGSADYELVAGERRLRASVLAGLSHVPCLVISCDDQQAAVYSLLENLQRVDLDPFEEAEGISRLIDEWGVTQEEAARRLGKRQSTIANKLRLLRLSEAQRRAIIQAGLSERHARALLRLQDDKVRAAALDQVIQNNLNVKQTDELVERVLQSVPEGAARGEGGDKHRRTVVIKDVRIFMNTIDRAVETMRSSGIPAVASRQETPDYIECVVRIPKSAALSTAKPAKQLTKQLTKEPAKRPDKSPTRGHSTATHAKGNANNPFSKAAGG